MLTRLRRLALAASHLGWAPAVALVGCGSSSSPPTTADASITDGNGLDADGESAIDADGAREGGASGQGESCVGFAQGTPCGASGLPAYGYVCVHGSPPGIAGCVLASSAGSFGDTWCCNENLCVAQPDQDGACVDAGVPHRFQGPPSGDAGWVAAPAACVAASGGGSALEKFYCCP
jgi:hypothetical protein